MAKRTYQVKKGDNYSNLGYDPQVLMNLNPGVSRLSTGQKIFVPGNYGSSSYMNPNLRPQNVAGNQVVPLPSGPSYTAATNTRVRLGNGQITSMPANTTMNFTQKPTMNVFQSAADVLMGRNTPGSMFYDNSGNSGVAVSRGNATMQTPGKGGNVNPMLVPVQNGFAGMNAGSGTGTFYPPVIKDPSYQTPPTPYTGTAGYWAGYNQANQGVQTGGSLSGDKQGQTPPLTQTVSRAEGRAQFLSGNGVNPDSGYIPTRADVWNMKANARRQKMRKMSGDEVQASYSGGGVSVPVDMTNNGNFVNSAVSWRVG